MRALLMTRHDADIKKALASLRVESLPRPEPGPGQVLVRIEAAPCNPSDLLFLQDRYGAFKTLPSVPGWEGAGTVVSAGRGLLARWLVGKRVACSLQSDRHGTWAEYFVTNATECLPLKKGLSIEQGASLLVNPMTAVALLREARQGGHPAAVHTAAASQLGRMLLAIANRHNYPVIHVVRRAAQVELLKSLGAAHIVDTSDPQFPGRLKQLCESLQATIAFEAVGGDLTGQVLRALPPKAMLLLYGALSAQPCSGVDPVDIIFRRKMVRGFYLGEWIKRRNLVSIAVMAHRVQNMVLDGTLVSEVHQSVALDDAVEALMHYVDHMTDGKILIRP